jgi:rod shape determining protein RodA
VDAKVAVIAGMAMLLAERREGEKDPKSRDVAQSLLIAALPMFLIMLQPDLGTAIIISASVVVVIAISGASWKWVAGLLLIACLGSVGAVKLHVLHDYQIKRLQSFVDPTADPQQSGYQLRQSRITIGSGGLLGKGLYKGPQTNGRFVPEQQTDFIFTVAGEELGFVGSAGIIGLFGIILWRAGRIARRSADLFGRLVAGGVMAWFAFQIFENIGMTMGLMPMTGVPLPLLSYGGTSLFAVLIGVGLLENVHVRGS